MENTLGPQVPVESQQLPKQSAAPLVPVLLVFLFIFVGLSIFFGYRYFQLQSAIRTDDNLDRQTPTTSLITTQTDEGATSAPDESETGWQLISSEVLGVEFSIPDSLTPDPNNVGEVPGEVGLQYCLTYNGGISLRLIPQVQAGGGPCDGGTLTLGAVTIDYEAGRGGGFGDMQRFQIIEGGYIISKPPNQQFEISPTLVREMVNQNNIHILVITGADERTEMYPEGVPVIGTPGEGKIGAIINLPNNSQYAGFTLQMKITKSDDRRIFDQILESIRPL